MGRILSKVACVMSVVSLLLVAAATAQLPMDFKQLQSRYPLLEKAWQEAKKTGDLTALKAELRPMLLATDAETRMMAGGWIESHREDMSLEQRLELQEFNISLHPDDRDNESRRSNMARERFEAWPVQRREEAYWEAVKKGSVVVEEHYELTKVAALAAAAFDGLEGFAPLVEASATSIDAEIAPEPDYAYSRYLKWLLQLKGGGDGGADRVALAAERLGAYPVGEFFSLMERDAAFRRVAQDAFRDACKEPTSAPCRGFARIALAQRDMRVAHLDAESAGQAQGWKPAYPPSWMSELWELTTTARHQEREDADKGDLVMRGPAIQY